MPTAYTGAVLPAFLYGTAWKKDATTRLVEQAIDAGFRGIDTANQLVHYDETRVGEALQALARRGIPRDALFLQTKFTPVNGQDHRLPYDGHASVTTQVRQSFDSSLQHLHTDTLDSYVLHGPYARYGLSDADWEVWAAIETLYDAGKTRLIGISNVSAQQLRLLCERARHKPMVVQNRCYAAMGWDREVRELCREHRIIYQGFSLLTANRGLFAEPELHAIARRLGAGSAQVIFAFALAVGMQPLTGTTSEQHMKADLEAADLTLTADEVRRIDTLGE